MTYMLSAFGFVMAALCFWRVVVTPTKEKAVAYTLLTVWFVGMAHLALIVGDFASMIGSQTNNAALSE